jgi:peptide/nickel transport system permease protein
VPDDRELASSGAERALLADRFPGQAAVGETVLSRQNESLDSEDMVATHPLGLFFWIALGFIGLVVLLAIIANLLPLPNPNFQNYEAINQAPSIHHLLGTDDLGRDLLSRLIFGARVSLVVGFGAVLIGMALGGTLGLISGVRGGRTDLLFNAGAFVILAFPAIVAVIAIVAFWGSSLAKITIIFGIGSAPVLFRVIRASALGFANREFVVAARTLGASSSRIIFREILPNVTPAAVSFGLITVAQVIVLEGTLAFLGLSVPLPTASWGNMISEGTANGNLTANPWILIWPTLAMFVLLLSINLIGDRLRQRFDIREGLL